MPRPIGSFSPSAVSALRIVTGAPVASDSATLSEVNFPIAVSATLGGPIDCYGLDTFFLGVEMAGDVAATCTLDLLVRDPGAASGARWKRLAPNAGGSPLVLAFGAANTNLVEVDCFGWFIYPRIVVTGSPTTVTILGFPGRQQPRLAQRAGVAWL